ncbi:MAG: DUF1343 domain-containing protein [Dissulfurispiraceae bacterium]|jgi:uncharacterized protein YbbC (DUF1343 family)|nr:DUF1343 domain-containing protein [Dissulfurispiraceae bacterium]
MPVLSGIDLLDKHFPAVFHGARAGLLVHPASVDSRLNHSADIFLRSDRVFLKALFGPQHGIYGQTQDNMVEWSGFNDPEKGIPVYSLYGETRKPTPEMLSGIDLLFVDVQDVGSRYYTFIWTLDLCMQACVECDKSIVVLDRPNPVSGGLVEGPVLDQNYSSFVGLKPITARHGMTIGEIAGFLKTRYYKGLDLHVIKMDGWKRSMWFDETCLPWVMPSPNMPTLDTATVYPGMCLLEGTNLSEGRGTTRPFEIFGSPYIDPEKLIKRLNEFKLKGVAFRHMFFEPTFQKYAGKLCGGAQIHVLDRNRFRPFKTAVAILKAVHDLWPESFAWKQPPYEYEDRKLPIDILSGTDRIRCAIESGADLDETETWWQQQTNDFKNNEFKEFTIYD